MIAFVLLFQTATWCRHRDRWSLLVFTVCLLIIPLIIEPQVVENTISSSRYNPQGIRSLRQRKIWGSRSYNFDDIGSYNFDDIDGYDRHNSSPKEYNSTPTPSSANSSSSTKSPSSTKTPSSDSTRNPSFSSKHPSSSTKSPAYIPSAPSSLSTSNPNLSKSVSPTRNDVKHPTVLAHPTTSPTDESSPTSSGTGTTLSPTEKLGTDSPTPNSSVSISTQFPTHLATTLIPSSDNTKSDDSSPTVSTISPDSPPTRTLNPTVPPTGEPVSIVPTSEVSDTARPNSFATGSSNPTSMQTAKPTTGDPTNSPTAGTLSPTTSPTANLITDKPTPAVFGTSSPNTPPAGTSGPTLSLTGTSPPTTPPTKSPLTPPSDIKCNIKATLGFDFDDPDDAPYYGQHADWIEVKKIGVTNAWICSAYYHSMNDNPAWCTYANSVQGHDSAHVDNWEDEYYSTAELENEVVSSESVKIKKAAQHPTLIEVYHWFFEQDYYPELPTWNDHMMAPKLKIFNLSNPTQDQIGDTYQHPTDKNVPTHLKINGEWVKNPEYTGNFAVHVTCNAFCYCEVTEYHTFKTDEPTDEPTNKPTSSSLDSTPSPTYHSDRTSTPTSTCRNDLDYRQNGDEKKSCAWVMLKKFRQEKFCAMEEVLNNCPVSCGTCCADDSTFIFTTNANNKRDCAWITENPAKREDKYCGKQFIRNRCLRTCNVCQSPTSTPTVVTTSPTYDTKHTDSPTPTCRNDPDYRYNAEIKNSCVWVTLNKSRQEKLCAMEEVLNNCPVSCGTCCTDDSTFTFRAKGIEQRDCAWITEKPAKREDKYCGKQFIRNRCLRACNVCVPPTSTPTPTTARPSQSLRSPTASPNKDTLSPSKASPTSSLCADLIYADFSDTETGTFTIIQFDYEIARDPSISGSLLWDILPNIESTLTNILIQDLLPNCKDIVKIKAHGNDKSKGGRKPHGKSMAAGNGKSRKLEELIGISSQPVDVLDSTSTCQSEIVKGSVCTPISGGVSLYLKGASSNIEYAAQSSIKKIMNGDLLLSAHGAVLKVIYMSKVKIRKNVGTYVNDTVEDDESIEFLKSGYFRGIMYGIVSGCVTIFIIRYAMTRKNETVTSHYISEGTEPDFSYAKSSVNDTTADDETIVISNIAGSISRDDVTVITSNKAGSIAHTRQKINKDEIFVDVDLENRSIASQRKQHDIFNTIFDESKEKKKRPINRSVSNL